MAGRHATEDEIRELELLYNEPTVIEFRDFCRIVLGIDINTSWASKTMYIAAPSPSKEFYNSNDQ